MTPDATLQPIPTPVPGGTQAPSTGPSPSSNIAAIVAPAVIVPIVVLFALLAAALLYKRRKDEKRQGAALGSDAGDLGAPLAADGASRSGSVGGMSQDGGAERAPSDVHIRLPSATAGRQ